MCLGLVLYASTLRWQFWWFICVTDAFVGCVGLLGGVDTRDAFWGVIRLCAGWWIVLCVLLVWGLFWMGLFGFFVCVFVYG